MKTKNRKKLKKVLKIVMAALIVFVFVPISSTNVKADSVTDTITVYVGYSGMNLDEYVQVGHYHWFDLYSSLLEYHEEAYSFFQNGNTDAQYTAIVDAARGFYIRDILDLCNIYYGDIYNLMFYVEDGKGIRSAFDRGALFCTRYYFDNLPGHRQIIYATKEKQVPAYDENGNQRMEKEYIFDEDGKPVIDETTGEQKYVLKPVYETVIITDYSRILGYNFDEVWNYAKEVQPMLAFEDNWASFNEEFTDIGPDFSYANAGNRFRLLFGQTYPTESLTSKSDKYVSAMYVTLYGSPKFGEIGEGKLGENTVELVIQDIYNQDLTDQLSKYLKIDSTNENVIRVTGIETISDSVYSDIARVIVHYEIVGDGVASFTGGFGSNDLSMDYSDVANIVVKDGKATYVNGKAPDPVQPPREDPDPEDKKDTNPEKEKETKPSEGNPEKNDEIEPETIQVAAADTNTEDFNEISDIEIIASNTAMYLLSDELAAKLGLDTSKATTKPKETITEVKIEDNTEEKAQEQKMILIYTGIGAAVLFCIGAVTEYFCYKRRLKHKKVVNTEKIKKYMCGHGKNNKKA